MPKLTIKGIQISSNNLVITYTGGDAPIPPPNPIKVCTEGSSCNPPIKQNNDSSTNSEYRGQYKAEWPTTWKKWSGENGYCNEQGKSGMPYQSSLYFSNSGNSLCLQGVRIEGGGYNASSVLAGDSWGGACNYSNPCTVNGVDTDDKFICKEWITLFGESGFVKITNPTDIKNADFKGGVSPYIPIAFGHGISGDERCGGCHLVRLLDNDYTYYLAVMTIDSATSSLEIGNEQFDNIIKYPGWNCAEGQSCPGPIGSSSNPSPSKIIDFIMLDECPQSVVPPNEYNYSGGKWWPNSPTTT
jgi:hypothetical protein